MQILILPARSSQNLMGMQRRKPMIIKQLEVEYMDNFCYIVGCEDTHQAMVIDPGSDVERI